jgi:hypothetical protein
MTLRDFVRAKATIPPAIGPSGLAPIFQPRRTPVGRFVGQEIRIVISASTSGAGEGHAHRALFPRNLDRIIPPPPFLRRAWPLVGAARNPPECGPIVHQVTGGAGGGFRRSGQVLAPQLQSSNENPLAIATDAVPFLWPFNEMCRLRWCAAWPKECGGQGLLPKNAR